MFWLSLLHRDRHSDRSRTSRCELLSTQMSRKQQRDRAIKRQFQNIFYWSPNPKKKRSKPQDYKKRFVCLRRRNSQEPICRNEITSQTALFIIRCFTSADMQNCSLELDRLRRWIWCQLKNISHKTKTKTFFTIAENDVKKLNFFHSTEQRGNFRIFRSHTCFPIVIQVK